jgi:hypothetical protein
MKLRNVKDELPEQRARLMRERQARQLRRLALAPGQVF